MTPSTEPPTTRGRRVIHWGEVAFVVWAILMLPFAVFVVAGLIQFYRFDLADYAVGVRTINTANVTYAATYPERGYAPTLRALGGSGTCVASAENACLIDDVLARGWKSGYYYTYRAFDRDGDGHFEAYTIHARPANPSTENHFYSDESGVIRTEFGKAAGPTSTPLQ